MQLIAVAVGTITSPGTTSKRQNHRSCGSRKTEPMQAHREQVRSAKGTAGVLATTTKRVQQQEEGESLGPGGGQRKEASLLMVNIPLGPEPNQEAPA